MQPFEDQMRAGGASAIRLASKFFMRDDPVHLSLRGIAEKLDQLEIPMPWSAEWRWSRLGKRSQA